MSPYRRNVMVGLTILVALLMLGWMIIRFGGGIARPFAPRQFPVTFVADRAEGVNAGSPIIFRGVEVGRVDRVQLSDDRMSVLIVGQIRQDSNLPGNLTASIRTQSALGTGAVLVLHLLDAQPTGALTSDHPPIEARFVGLEFLPPEIGELAGELRTTVAELRESNLIGNINQQVQRVGELIDSASQFLEDEQLRENIRQTLANTRQATEHAAKVAANLEEFSGTLSEVSRSATTTLSEARGAIGRADSEIARVSRDLNARLAQISTILERLHATAVRIDRGEGTIGRLINDPRLHDGLVDASRELNLTIKDLRRLIEQWEQEGVSLRLTR